MSALPGAPIAPVGITATCNMTSYTVITSPCDTLPRHCNLWHDVILYDDVALSHTSLSLQCPHFLLHPLPVTVTSNMTSYIVMMSPCHTPLCEQRPHSLVQPTAPVGVTATCSMASYAVITSPCHTPLPHWGVRIPTIDLVNVTAACNL